MQIHNVRLGFACNSSSTHSLILLPSKKRKVQDELGEGSEFGWEFFTAASRKAKTQYLGVLLRDTLLNSLGAERSSHLLAEQLLDIKLPKDAYIDHQSIISLPLDWNNKDIHEGFLQELLTFLQQDNLVILGGNDNRETKHPLWREDRAVNLPLKRDSRDLWVARKDNDYWTLFDRKNGAKIRFSFQELAASPTKATYPELVDLKITGFCPYGCPYCYQASTADQMHADYSYVTSLIYNLADMQVFEVALGGGEPTLHPKFWSIVQTLSYKGIVPNFTTRNLSWIHDAESRAIFLDVCGSCAYSVNSQEDVIKLSNLIGTYGIPPEKFAIQAIDGITNLYGLFQRCHERRLRVTLLGLKRSGFGEHYTSKHEFSLSKGMWVQCLQEAQKEYRCPSFGIDTLIAQEYLPKLKELEIPEYLYQILEGRFSMYIDAVTKKAAPSSYCDPSQFQMLTDNYQAKFGIPALFAGF